VSKLELPPNDYVLFGSVPMLAHGLISAVNDIDILARGEAWAKALELKSFERAAGGDRVIRLGNCIDIFDAWMTFDKKDILLRAQPIGGLPYADLQDVLEFKRYLNRPKDKVHIELLEAHIARG